jgi:hypothetical protein
LLRDHHADRTSSSTLNEEQSPVVFENKIPKKIFVSKREAVMGLGRLKEVVLNGQKV